MVLEDISVGPTTASVLLSLQLVGGISAAARIPPQVVLPALTLAVSGWFLIFGLLGLGFIFDLIPVFLCIALVSAIATIIIALQVPFLLGLLGITTNFTEVVPEILKNLGKTNGRTVAMSAAAIVFLGTLLSLRGKWGRERTTRGRISRIGTATGALLVIVVFAGVSSIFLRNVPLQQQVAPFIPPVPAMGSGTAAPQAALSNSTSGVTMINPTLQGQPARRTRRQATGSQLGAGNLTTAALPGTLLELPQLPFWAAFPEFITPISTVQVPILQLAKSLFMPSFILFISVNLEHIVVARYFAHQQGYTISKSQEMFTLGLINAVNSLFGGVPVGGGDMARSSILGFIGAKSQLNQILTSATVLIAMTTRASDALRFLPQATLASIIAVAVFDQMPLQSLVNTYFKLSFADFVAFIVVLGAGTALPTGVNTIVAIGAGVVFMTLYTMLRIMFKRPKAIDNTDLENLYKPGSEDLFLDGEVIAPSTLLIKIEGDVIFANAERMRRRIVDAAYLRHTGRPANSSEEPERVWDASVDKYINSLRRWKGADCSSSLAVFRPRLRMVILDMRATSFIDTSALMSLEILKKQLRDWAGDAVEFRFVGLNKHLQRRFSRAKWQIVDPFGPRVEVYSEDDDVRDFMFDSIPQALRYVSQDMAMNGTFSQIVGSTDFPKEFDY